MIDLIEAIRSDKVAVEALSNEMRDNGEACQIVPAVHRVHRQNSWGGLALTEAVIPTLNNPE